VKKFVATAMMASALMVGSATGVIAHQAGPCNDTDGDGEFSGQEYAEHHIVAGAHDGFIGHEHKPGQAHKGFSACNPSGR